MRIVCANWSRRRVGGIEAYIAAVVPLLQRLGHDVALWAERDEPQDRGPIEVAAATAVWCAERDGLDASLLGIERWRPSVLFVHGLTDPDVEARLMQLAPSVLMAHSYYGTCISGGKTTRFPSTSPCARTFGPACLGHYLPRRCGGLHPLTMVAEYRRQRARLDLVRQYDRVLTLSAHMRSEYLRHGLGPERVVQLPPYLPLVSRCEVKRRSAELELLFLGRLDHLKGCAMAIRALPRVQQHTGRAVRLLVAGDGPDRSSCERAARSIASRSIRIEFCGWIDDQARGALLAGTDVLVFPSLWPEPYGLAALEARAAGVPVAAFASGAIPEWLSDGVDGALAGVVPSSDGLAAAIVRCAALGRIAPWTPDLMVERRRAHVTALGETLAGVAALASGIAVP